MSDTAGRRHPWLILAMLAGALVVWYLIQYLEANL
jgi:hypothetical protein